MKQKLPNCLSGGVLRALSLLTLLLTLGLNSYADEASLILAKGSLEGLTDTSSKTIVDNQNNSWKFEMTGKGTLQNFDSTKGQQFGSSSNAISSLKITSDGFADKIVSKVTLSTSCASKGSSSVAVEVGDTDFVDGNNNTSHSLVYDTNNETIVFTGNASGEVSINYTVSSKAIYLLSIKVEYEDGIVIPPTSCDTPLFNVTNGANVEVGSNIIATCATKNSTVTITDNLGNTVEGDIKSGKAVYNVPNSIGGTITLTAVAKVAGENGEIVSDETTITITVIAALPITNVVFDFSNAPSFSVDGGGTIAPGGSSANSNKLNGKTISLDGVAIKFDSNSGTEPRWWNSPNQLRLYVGNNMTITAPDGKIFDKITIEKTEGTISASIGNYDNNSGVWTPTIAREANDGVATVVFTPSVKSFINSITVDYKDAPVSTGIVGIEAEVGEAVYYNLQGVRVENPVKGLYIRVANGKSQKVIL